MSDEERNGVSERLTIAPQISALGGMKLVVEAIIENMDLASAASPDRRRTVFIRFSAFVPS